MLDAEVRVRRGGFELDVEIAVAAGEVLAVLGPNGAGKSTLLRVLAGLLPLGGGRVRLGDDVWDDPAAGIYLDAVQRPVGLVFQDYRLFPHLSVQDNVAFGARARGAPRRAAREQAARWLDAVGLRDLAGYRPGELSGGQAQRVALARALAAEPRMLLLDEPLAALDARTRLELRGGLRRHLTGFDGPSVVVTHDPLEAMVLADRILVLEHGHRVQEGPPALVARRPATEYVARLVGLNLYAGVVTGGGRIRLDGGGVLVAAGADATLLDAGFGLPAQVTGQRMLLALSPSAITLHVREPDAGSARNVWPGRIAGMELLTDRVRVAVEGRPPALVDITPAALTALGLAGGQQVWLSAKATEVTAYPDAGGSFPAAGGDAGGSFPAAGAGAGSDSFVLPPSV